MKHTIGDAVLVQVWTPRLGVQTIKTIITRVSTNRLTIIWNGNFWIISKDLTNTSAFKAWGHFVKKICPKTLPKCLQVKRMEYI